MDGFYNGTVDFGPGSGVFNMNDAWAGLYKQKMFLAKFDAGGDFA